MTSSDGHAAGAAEDIAMKGPPAAKPGPEPRAAASAVPAQPPADEARGEEPRADTERAEEERAAEEPAPDQVRLGILACVVTILLSLAGLGLLVRWLF